MTTPLLILTYCLLIVLASLVGGWIPQWIQLTHKRMELAISGIAGFMLGVGLLHMLPHAQEAIGSIHRTVLWLLAGGRDRIGFLRARTGHSDQGESGDQGFSVVHGASAGSSCKE